MSDLLALIQERRRVADAAIPRVGGLTLVGSLAIFGSVIAFTGHSETATAWALTSFVVGDLLLGWQVAQGHMIAARLLVEAAEAEIEVTRSKATALGGAEVVQVNENHSGKQQASVIVRQGSRIYRLNEADRDPTPRLTVLKDADVLWLLERFCQLGLARAKHLQQPFPYSRGLTVTRPIYNWALQNLTELDLAVRKGRGAESALCESNPRRLYQALNRRFPNGFQIQLPPPTRPT